jgi:hypothetical protein
MDGASAGIRLRHGNAMVVADPKQHAGTGGEALFLPSAASGSGMRDA